MSSDTLLANLSKGFDQIFGDVPLVPERRRAVEIEEPESLRHQRERLEDEYEAAHEALQARRKELMGLLPPHMPAETLVALEEYAEAKAKLEDVRRRREFLGIAP